MKDLRKLIRKVLREETNQPDVELDIMNYKGDDSEINKMKSLIYSGKILTPKDIEYAESFFEKNEKEAGDEADDDNKEIKNKILNWIGDDGQMKNLLFKVYSKQKLSKEEIQFAKEFFEKEKKLRISDKNTMSKKVTDYRGAYEQQSKIQELGQTVYEDIIKSDLSIFLNNIFNPKFKIQIGKPSEGWFEKNLEDLRQFYNDTKKYHNNNVSWRDGTEMSIGNKIIELGKRLKNRDWIGIIENGDWSILNKVDTNYLSWAKEISKRQVEGDLPMGGDVYIIEKYFQKRDVEDVLPKKWLQILKKIEQEKNIKVGKMSFAHVDFIDKFHEDKESSYGEFVGTLQKSTQKGDEFENEFFQLIRNVPDNFREIKRYALWGNVIDINFGVDGSYFGKDGFKLVQVKSSESGAKKAFVKRLGIPYVSVYPQNPKNKVRNYRFYYYSENNTQKPEDFNKDFVNTKNNSETYAEKEKKVLDKYLGQPGLGQDYFR